MRRLQTRPQFDAVMAGGTVARTAHFALHRAPLEATPAAPGPGSSRPQALFAVQDAWMGAVVPKRWAKRAVTRNGIRRQIFAVSQEAHATLPQAAHVVRLRAGFDRQLYPSAWSEPLRAAVRGELQQLFARAAQAGAGRPPGRGSKAAPDAGGAPGRGSKAAPDAGGAPGREAQAQAPVAQASPATDAAPAAGAPTGAAA